MGDAGIAPDGVMGDAGIAVISAGEGTEDVATFGEGGFIPGHVPRAIQALSRLITAFPSESVGAAEQAEANKKASSTTLITNILFFFFRNTPLKRLFCNETIGKDSKVVQRKNKNLK